MEVQLTFDQEAKLTRMATEQGRAAETKHPAGFLRPGPPPGSNLAPRERGGH